VKFPDKTDAMEENKVPKGYIRQGKVEGKAAGSIDSGTGICVNARPSRPERPAGSLPWIERLLNVDDKSTT